MFRRVNRSTVVSLITLTIVLATLLTATFPVWANDNNRLVVNLWYELKPVASLEGEEYPIPKEKALKKLLEEARIILSAMIYGYNFTYTPSDRARKVKEIFELKPLTEIKWGDPKLKVLQTEVKDNRIYASISYTLLPFQEKKRLAWSSNSIPVTTGFGKGSIFKGEEGRNEALSNAIKEAIRNHLRPRIYNKPREIRGEILLWDSPYTTILHGEYLTKVRIKLIVKELIPYRIF